MPLIIRAEGPGASASAKGAKVDGTLIIQAIGTDGQGASVCADGVQVNGNMVINCSNTNTAISSAQTN